MDNPELEQRSNLLRQELKAWEDRQNDRWKKYEVLKVTAFPFKSAVVAVALRSLMFNGITELNPVAVA